jgi:penicillin-binding protein 1A
VATARRLGITSPLNPTPSISLGTSEVTPLELTAAFVPFANGGRGVMAHVIDRIVTAWGTVLYERTGSGPGQIIDPRSVAMMNGMMKETLSVGTGRSAQIAGWPAAGKTGTSQDYRDAWFIGYTGALTAGVWFGNDDGKPTARASGSNLPAITWQRFMTEALAGEPVVGLPGDPGFDGGIVVAGGADYTDNPAPLFTEPFGGFFRRLFGG